VNKTFHAVDKYAEGFPADHGCGISPHALIIFGLPDDNPKRSSARLIILNVEGADHAVFYSQPYPGSPTGDKIWRSGVGFRR
jgi:hypothetical protein